MVSIFGILLRFPNFGLCQKNGKRRSNNHFKYTSSREAILQPFVLLSSNNLVVNLREFSIKERCSVVAGASEHFATFLSREIMDVQPSIAPSERNHVKIK